MSKKTFAIGDRVGMVKVYPKEDCTLFGVVEDTTAAGNVKVKWDSKYFTNTSYYLPPDSLLPETEAIQKADQLNAEFVELNKQIASKMETVAHLIKEADQLAISKGTSLMDMEASGIFLDAMSEVGWSISSLSC